MKRGHLRAAYTPEFVDKIETYARDARDCGLDLEVLSTNMLRDRFPYLGPEITAGVWDREGGHANPASPPRHSGAPPCVRAWT